jgi:uncharacterized repeat protein (TIGR03803 family)
VVTNLYNFGGTPTDGIYPDGSLTQIGGTLYGATEQGGINNSNGTIFKIGPSGAGYLTMYSFGADPAEGRGGTGALVAVGSTLYGLTLLGGTGNGGTVYKINADNTGYTVLHRFTGGANDGFRPQGALLVVGGVLYGTTDQGGSANGGTVFRMNPDGTGFQVIHSFSGGPNDGRGPVGTLVTDGSTLYGMSNAGGAANGGTIFKLNLEGSGFGIIHSFTGGANDGQYPAGSLTLVGSTLHGMTPQGGSVNLGVAFRVGTDGSAFALAHSFGGPPGDGSSPDGGFTGVGSELYGLTATGGSAALGTLFGIGTDGSGYNSMYSFKGFPNDGANPLGDPLYLNGALYGMTQVGGSQAEGVVFSFPIPVPEPSSFYLVAAAAAGILSARRRKKQ